MSLLTPAWLLLGILAVPILLMYMLKLKRREVRVSSILLWQMLLRDRQANTPWQRLKRNWLLILQLLILLALVLALTRPAMRVPQAASGSLVVLLDASASMAATDVQPNRFAAAVEVVEGLIDNLDSSEQMTLILVADQPSVLAAGESDKKTLSNALGSVNVTQEAANWGTAFAIASGAAASINDPDLTTVIVSDGGITKEDFPPLPGEILYFPVGSSDTNLAISALAVRPAELSAELFSQVTNYGSQIGEAVFSIYLNDTLIEAQEITVPPFESEGISISNFPTDPGIISARITRAAGEAGNAKASWDLLELDNQAYTINHQLVNRSVLIITPGNFFIDQIMAAFPSIQSYRAVPTKNPALENPQFILPETPFDLYVIDGSLPTSSGLQIPTLPHGNLLLINPPSNPLFPVTGTFEPVNMQITEHLMTKNLSWENVHIKQANHVDLPEWAEILVDSPGGPLVFAGEYQGQRMAVLSFDLHDSDLPLQVDFPILFANLLDYLLPSQIIQQEGSLQPNQSIELLLPLDVNRITIDDPEHRSHSLTPTEQGYFFNQTSQTGVYMVKFTSAGSQRTEYFAINLFNPLESDITPQESMQAGRATIPSASQAGLGLLENWSWFATLGLGLIVFEWWYYHRRSSFSISTQLRKFIKRSIR